MCNNLPPSCVKIKKVEERNDSRASTRSEYGWGWKRSTPSAGRDHLVVPQQQQQQQNTIYKKLYI